MTPGHIVNDDASQSILWVYLNSYYPGSASDTQEQIGMTTSNRFLMTGKAVGSSDLRSDGACTSFRVFREKVTQQSYG